MKPHPILFVDHATSIGGAENSLLMLLQHLDRSRVQPFLACEPGDLAEAARKLNIPTYCLMMPRLRRSPSLIHNFQQTTNKIAELTRQIDAEAIYSNTIRATFYSAGASRRAKCPHVWHMRDYWLSENTPRYKAIDKALKQLLVGNAALVITNSNAVAQHMPGSNKVVSVHNGIDLARFSTPDRHFIRRTFNIPEEKQIIGMMGRLRPWKGQATFLRIAALVKAQRPQTHFVCIGGSPFEVDDTYAENLVQQTTALGLSSDVTFTGHLSNVADALSGIDVFVHPGSPEPFGLVNIEAMAVEKPVVAFSHGALPEIVMHDETGFLVPPEDERAMADAIVSLLDSDEMRARFGRNGRVRVEEHFTIERTAAEISTHLWHLLEKTG